MQISFLVILELVVGEYELVLDDDIEYARFLDELSYPDFILLFNHQILGKLAYDQLYHSFECNDIDIHEFDFASKTSEMSLDEFDKIRESVENAYQGLYYEAINRLGHGYIQDVINEHVEAWNYSPKELIKKIHDLQADEFYVLPKDLESAINILHDRVYDGALREFEGFIVEESAYHLPFDIKVLLKFT